MAALPYTGTLQAGQEPGALAAQVQERADQLQEQEKELRACVEAVADTEGQLVQVRGAAREAAGVDPTVRCACCNGLCLLGTEPLLGCEPLLAAWLAPPPPPPPVYHLGSNL